MNTNFNIWYRLQESPIVLFYKSDSMYSENQLLVL